MRIFLFILLWSTFTCYTYAQNRGLVNTRTGEDYTQTFSVPPLKIVDKVKFAVLYRLEILHDTINKDAVKKDNVMLLQIGGTIDKYSDYFKGKMDSLIWTADLSKKKPTEYLDEAYQMGRGALKEELYTNYPSLGKITVCDYVLGGFYQYEESIPKIKWKLDSGTNEIVGYKCKKASCRLFGRDYVVWYTSEIPISKGPWKFSGLPGLILQVEDSRNQISWTCVGLQKMKQSKDIYVVDRDPIKTSKKECLKTFNDYQKNKLNWIKASGAVSTPISEKANKSMPYNPIELSE